MNQQVNAPLFLISSALAALSGTVIGLAPIANSVPVPKSPSSSCDSNYSGACVPVARDVDCAGGSGNGPEYVSGPVTVVGEDVYGLDRDGDGVGCDS